VYSNDKNAAINRQLKKEVLSSRLIHSFSSTDGVNITGPGSMEISDEVCFEGNKTLKVTFPNLVFPVPQSNRNYDCTRIRLDFDKENWEEYNRISFWIYPIRNGFDFFPLCMEYKSEGEKPFPNENFLSGCHSFPITAGKWNHVIWEIPELPRDAVTMFQINFVTVGMQANMELDSVAFISNFELQKVDADKSMGWDTDGKISFCHSGYSPEDIKIATTSLMGDNEFYIIEENSEDIVFEGKVQKFQNDLGIFNRLDFSTFEKEGSYYIKYSDVTTPVFIINKNHWFSVTDKLHNFFAKERCGCFVEGIHLPCHQNTFTVHPDGRKLSVAGGWHDAADLSQGLCNTSEAVHSFIDAAESLKDKNPALSEKLLNEAHYGLEWMLNTRFEDGFRCIWNTSGHWVLGYTNGIDDYSRKAGRFPFECLCATAAEAAGYIAFKDKEPMFAQYCLTCAKEDFEFAISEFNDNDYFHLEGASAVTPVQLNAETSFAASMIYRATKDEKYIEHAIKFADYVLDCQQITDTDWDTSFKGFFYEDTTKTAPLNYDHRAHDQVIMMSLSSLLELKPEHENASSWKKAIELYRDYIYTLLSFASPFGQIPAGIYFADTPSTLTGSGDHKKAKFVGDAYLKQIKNGVKLSENVYLRRFPTARVFRGSYGLQLSKAKAVSTAALALKDKEFLEIAKQQLAFILGNNPFARSFVFGEGYDYPNMDSPFNSFDVAGEIPVGMHSFGDTDIPYMPMTNQATYFEVWVHPASRMLWTLADLF